MRIFQTFILPERMVSKLGLSNAAANFSRNLIGGGCFNRVYSLIPVNINGELGAVDETEYEVVYSPLRKNVKLSRLATFAEQWKIFKKIRKNDTVWFYNLNIINVGLFLLLKLLKPSVKRCVIILDFTPANSWREQNYWYLKLINIADGTICLSPSKLFTVRNTILLPGVVPESTVKYPRITKINHKFLLSGVISENIALTKIVLEAFAKLPETELYITGKVLENEDIIKKYAAAYHNIRYLGKVSYEEYMLLLDTVTFQLSTRNPESPENQCNFPSKIIESLLHNRIILSTLHYPQLDGIRYFEIGHDVNSMVNSLRTILSMPASQILEYANQSEKVKSMFGTQVWAKAIEQIEHCHI